MSTTNVLKHLAVQCQVHHDLLEAIVLVLELLQSTHLVV